MITDPLFILGFIGMTVCLFAWIKFNLASHQTEPFVLKYISFISSISGLAILLSIFYNSGDLGIVLLFGSIVSFFIMVLGYYLKNDELLKHQELFFTNIYYLYLRTFYMNHIKFFRLNESTKKGDFLLVNKFAYGLKVNRIGIPNILKSDPQYGDAVVIIPPHNPVPYIKRLIGKPGDTIRIVNKKIYINGNALDREFLKTEEITIKKRYKYSSGEIVERDLDATADLYFEKHTEAEYLIRLTRGENDQYPQEWTVPENHYFVMGDNRDNSNDSTKDVGFVPRENFFGRADYIWMTWECWTCLPSFEKVGRIK